VQYIVNIFNVPVLI